MDLSSTETLKEKGVSVLQPQGGAPPAVGQTARMDGSGGSGPPRIPEELSILPVRGFVMFPGAVIPLTVSRPASIKLLDETLPITKIVGFLTQRDEQKEEPTPQDLYHVGTAAIVLKLLLCHPKNRGDAALFASRDRFAAIDHAGAEQRMAG
jgi:ATP-dependent Lon protease